MSAPAAHASTPTPTFSAFFNIYGCEVHLRSSSLAAFKGINADFSHFRSEHVIHPLQLDLLEQPPPYDSVPQLTATVYTPRNISFRDGNLTYVDYFGRALAIDDRSTARFCIYSCDTDLLYEAAYLFLLSRAGEFLDGQRLHRVHALAISIHGQAALVLLPMGGGKSTLGAELLRHPEVKFLSDDSPLIDRHGGVHGFPLRMGLLPGGEGGVPEDQLRRINRMEFGPKLLVDYSYFSERVCPYADPGFIFLGSRSLSRDCSISPATTAESLRAMLANCVIGLGLFQGMEFVFQRDLFELAGKAGVAYSRLRNSLALVRRSKKYHLVLGRDIQKNALTVIRFLTSHPADG